MGGLAHYLEEEELATIQISLIRPQTEKTKPPRALWVPFELGRPMGAPNDPEFQKKVLRAALGLLDRDGGPVFGTVPKVLWERSVKPDRKNRVRMGLNCLLIRTPDANVLVDCGSGNKEPDISKEIYGHSSSKLLRNLRAEGLAARDIDWGVLTHLHFDH